MPFLHFDCVSEKIHTQPKFTNEILHNYNYTQTMVSLRLPTGVSNPMSATVLPSIVLFVVVVVDGLFCLLPYFRWLRRLELPPRFSTNMQ